MPKGYDVRQLSEAPTVRSACGCSTRVFTGLDGSTANLHVTHITDSLRHYHKQCTEYYYVLEGSGTIELGDEEYPLSPGTVVRIDPMTPHRAYGNLTTIVFGVPAWNPDDEYYLTDAPDTTGAAV